MKKNLNDKAGKILNIWVKPRASRNEILGYENDLLRLRVTASPIGGEANLLVRKVLAEALGIPPSRVEIIKGEKGRMKRVRIVGAPQRNWTNWATHPVRPKTFGKDPFPEAEGGKGLRPFKSFPHKPLFLEFIRASRESKGSCGLNNPFGS